MISVSVIIPYYKKKKFIQATLDSALNQSFKAFEIILIYDDEDNTDLKLIRHLKKKDKRIKLIINKKNLGAGYSRNLGIKKAKGKYIAFLDSDDIWLKDKLKSQIEFMKKNKSIFSSTSYEIINEKNKFISNRITEDTLMFKDLVKSCDIGLSTVIIEKKVFNKQIKFPDLKTKEDYVLWLKILQKKNCKVFGLKKILTRWRSTENSLSSNFFQKIKDGYKVYNHYLKLNPLKSLYFLMVLSINFLRK